MKYEEMTVSQHTGTLGLLSLPPLLALSSPQTWKQSKDIPSGPALSALHCVLPASPGGSFSVSKQGKRGSERCSNLPKVTQLARGRDLSHRLIPNAGLPSKETGLERGGDQALTKMRIFKPSPLLVMLKDCEALLTCICQSTWHLACAQSTV